MKRLFWVILAIFLAYGSGDAHKAHRQGRFSLFYSSLSPHGEWISLEMGRVWRPYNVGRQWRPYSEGRWIWTDFGWYWISDEPFGWATYHYGRWTYDDYYGWIWVPDDVWGPAWVEWRYDNDYIGWAPLPPQARFSLSVGITFGNVWVAPVHYWNFVPCGNFSSVHLRQHIQTVDFTRRIIGRTRNVGRIRSVNNRIVNEGVGIDHIERRTRQRVGKVDVVERGSAGADRLTRKDNRDMLEIYRPGPDDLRKEGVVRTPAGRGVEMRNAPGGRERTGVTNDRDPRTSRQSVDELRKSRNSQRDPGTTRQERQQPRVRTTEKDRKPAKPDGLSVNPDRRTVKPEVRGSQRAGTGSERPSVKRSVPSAGRERPSVNRERPPRKVEKPAARSGKKKGDGR